MAQLKEELVLDSSQFDKKIVSAIDRVKQLKKQGKDVGGGFNSSLGGMIAKCTALTGALSASAIAAKAFGEVLQRNDAIGDAFNSTMESAKSSINTFWNALAKGNFNTFVSDLNNATKAAREAYEAIDNLETTKTFNQFKLQELETAYKKALILSKDRNISEKDRLKYLNQAKNIMAQQNQILMNQQKLLANSANKKMNKLLAENGLSKLMNDKKMQDWYFGNKETLEREVARVEKLREQARKKYTRKVSGTNQYGVQYGGTIDGGYKEWERKNKAILDRAERFKNFLNMMDTAGDELNDILQDRIEYDNIDLKITQDQYNTDLADYRLHKGINKELSERETLLKKVQSSLESQMQKTDKIVQAERQQNSTTNNVPLWQLLAQDFELRYKVNEGDVKDIYQKYDDLARKIQQAFEDYDIGIISDKELQATIDAINKQIEALGLKPIKIEIETDAQKKLGKTADLIDDISSSFATLGQSLEMPALNVAGIIGQAIASIIQGYAQATAQASTLGPWAWIAFSLAGLAQITSVISQIHSLSGYANGGVVGGSSYGGDRLLARVNSGEAILTQNQQSHLFEMLNNGNYGTVSGGNVNFVIRGSDLYGVLTNYNNIKNKLR